MRFAVAGSTLGAGVAAAQADLPTALIGTWRGELQNTALALRIGSVRQEDGKWIAHGRFGPTPVKIDIDTTRSKPALRWAGASGTTYDLSRP